LLTGTVRPYQLGGALQPPGEPGVERIVVKKRVQSASNAPTEKDVNREIFDSLNKVVGLINLDGKFEAVGFDNGGQLCYFTHEGVAPVSLAASVEMLHRLELKFCEDDPPDWGQNDDARDKWFTMLEKELVR
jgi:hypothetical protein